MRAKRLLPFSNIVIFTALILAGCVQQNPPQTDTTPQNNAEQLTTPQPEHILLREAEVVWSDAPPVLPAGAKIAVLEGDPSKAGPFTLRLMFPPSYSIPPHFHPADEHVTVLSGDFAVGMGETFDDAALKDLGIGGFAMMRTGVRHFARSNSGTVIQLHGIGPWGLTYVNPADDPRNAVK